MGGRCTKDVSISNSTLLSDQLVDIKTVDNSEVSEVPKINRVIF